MMFIEQLFVEEDQPHIDVYEKFCKTICRIGLAYKIKIETHMEDVSSCECCSYFITYLVRVRVIMSMDTSVNGYRMKKEWYDYDFDK